MHIAECYPRLCDMPVVVSARVELFWQTDCRLRGIEVYIKFYQDGIRKLQLTKFTVKGYTDINLFVTGLMICGNSIVVLRGRMCLVHSRTDNTG